MLFSTAYRQKSTDTDRAYGFDDLIMPYQSFGAEAESIYSFYWPGLT